MDVGTGTREDFNLGETTCGMISRVRAMSLFLFYEVACVRDRLGKKIVRKIIIDSFFLRDVVAKYLLFAFSVGNIQTQNIGIRV